MKKIDILKTGMVACTVLALFGCGGSSTSNTNSVPQSIPIVTIDTIEPLISTTFSPGDITTSSAIITWITDDVSTSQVEYGTTTSYGSTVLDSTLVSNHVQLLSGLTPSTTYHYRVISQDVAGNIVVSEDQIFTTAAESTPPEISNITTSNTTGTSVTISWITDEPATTEIQYGMTLSYESTNSLNTLQVTTHSQNLTGLLSSTTYNFMVLSRDAAGNLATSGNNTFTTTSAPPDTTVPIISNILIANTEASSATITWITNEVATTQVEYGTTTAYGLVSTLNTTLLTGHTQALSGLAPSTLYNYRVKSTDALGNEATSSNNTFTTSSTPDTTAPVISSIAADTITPNSAVISWITDEAASTQIEYGTTTAYGLVSTLNTTLLTSHTQALSDLAASTLYNYRVKSTDAVGNGATSSNNTFTTFSTPDTTAPVISNIAAGTIISNSAVISWITDEAASTQIEYGTTTAYGLVSTLNATLLTSHSQSLNGLAASTLYNYRVKSADAVGNGATSENNTFTTSTPDTTAPIISSIVASTITPNSAVISWITDEAASTQVEYGPTTAYGLVSILNATLLTSHSQALSGLTSSTLYNYRVKSTDAAGNGTTSANKTFTTPEADTAAPVISSIAAGTITRNSALISWITDEGSTTQIEYGPTTAYGFLSTLKTALVTSHSQTLNNLTEFTLYNYRVISTDAAGNVATSTNNTFTTLDTTPPIISGIAASTITANSVAISWVTNEVASAQVEYGPTTAYGSVSTLDTTLLTTHSPTLSGMASSTLYNYRVMSTDASGNVAISSNNTFTTVGAGTLLSCTAPNYKIPLYYRYGMAEPPYTENNDHALLDASVFTIPWATVEAQEGVYDWSIVDQQITEWIAGNPSKKVYLKIVPYTTGSPLSDSLTGDNTATPVWVYQYVPRITFLDKDEVTISVPKVWDATTFYPVYTNFIQALAEKYGNDPRIVAIQVGWGHLGTWNASPAPDSDVAFTDAGWTVAVWQIYLQDVIDIYEAVFVNKTTHLVARASEGFMRTEATVNNIDVAKQVMGHAGLNNIWALFGGLDPDQSIDAWGAADIVSYLGTLNLSSSYFIGFTDDWPLWALDAPPCTGGTEDDPICGRDVVGFEAELKLAIDTWDLIGRKYQMFFIWLDSEVSATNVNRPEFNQEVYDVAMRYLCQP